MLLISKKKNIAVILICGYLLFDIYMHMHSYKHTLKYTHVIIRIKYILPAHTHTYVAHARTKTCGNVKLLMLRLLING